MKKKDNKTKIVEEDKKEIQIGINSTKAKTSKEIKRDNDDSNGKQFFGEQPAIPPDQVVEPKNEDSDTSEEEEEEVQEMKLVKGETLTLPEADLKGQIFLSFFPQTQVEEIYFLRTSNGILIKLLYEAKALIFYPDAQGRYTEKEEIILSGHIFSIYEDSKERIWIGGFKINIYNGEFLQEETTLSYSIENLKLKELSGRRMTLFGSNIIAVLDEDFNFISKGKDENKEIRDAIEIDEKTLITINGSNKLMMIKYNIENQQFDKKNAIVESGRKTSLKHLSLIKKENNLIWILRHKDMLRIRKIDATSFQILKDFKIDEIPKESFNISSCIYYHNTLCVILRDRLLVFSEGFKSYEKKDIKEFEEDKNQNRLNFLQSLEINQKMVEMNNHSVLFYDGGSKLTIYKLEEEEEEEE